MSPVAPLVSAFQLIGGVCDEMIKARGTLKASAESLALLHGIEELVATMLQYKEAKESGITYDVLRSKFYNPEKHPAL